MQTARSGICEASVPCFPLAAPRPLKRLFDICLATLGLVLLSPLLLLFAIAVKLDSRGPVFFRQERVGRGFRPFRIFKFRTMVVDAPQRGGQITAGHDDPRITRVGRFLRRWKFDELPQFLNVVKGEMSLVGPRPEVPRYVEMFRSDYAEILTIRPGITDLASIKYRDEAGLLAGSANPEQTYVQEILPQKLALAARICRAFVVRRRSANSFANRAADGGRLTKVEVNRSVWLRRRWVRRSIAVAVVLIVLAALHRPLLHGVASFLIVDQPLAPADYLVLLPGTVDNGIEADQVARRVCRGRGSWRLIIRTADVARGALWRMGRSGDDAPAQFGKARHSAGGNRDPARRSSHDLGCRTIASALARKATRDAADCVGTSLAWSPCPWNSQFRAGRHASGPIAFFGDARRH